METEELIKLVDGIYKNILDKFNPGARQMINAGKAYLKALHGAAAASRLYVDAISKLAKQAQQGTWGGCSDIGQALLKVVEVYKDIQDQQMNILKAFYVDLLVPLETNLEKDTKVVQSEQKRFLQQHKQRSETYSKAAANMKKQRKKSKGTSKGGLAMDKELKNMQMLEEEKTKLDAFCEQSLKNAMTQERRRYGFVLERHCSLTKHYLSYHTQSAGCYQQNLDKWVEVAKTREYLPDSVENIFNHKIKQVSIWQDEDFYSNPRSPHYDDDRMSISSQLRKTKSMDASCLDIRSIQEVGSPINTLSRAKSEFNLNSSSNSLTQVEMHSPTRRPKSMAVPPGPPPQWETQLARALYAYLSSGDNQLSFLEGDVIALMGERNKGWQFGENLRTQSTGWFPLAYTEILDESTFSPKHRSEISGSTHNSNPSGITASTPMSPGTQSNTSTLDTTTPRMFGDTLHIHRSSANAKQIRRAIASNNIPPPALPAPIPTPTVPYNKSGISQSQSTTFVVKPNSDTNTFSTSHPPGMRTSTSSFNFTTPSSGSYSTHPQTARGDKSIGVNPLPLHLQSKGGKIGGPVGNVSLHSSNDSGFSNDPPPQPEIDYSDDDSTHGQTKVPVRLNRRQSISDANNNQRKVNPVRPSRSSNNLTESRHYITDDQSLILYTDEKKSFVKRTKSFWKFGKNASDNEVLEGMALWKHRDLVDINERECRQRMLKRRVVENGHGKASPNGSHDSDITLNAKQYEEAENKPKSDIRKRHESFKENSKLSLPPRKEEENNDDFENRFEKRPSPSQYYDDEDGLVLKTVNRKSIVQKYCNDSTEQDSDSGSESNTDDPYDCIVINDQQLKKNREATNVAAIGKKLEKLSKNSKYSPTKERTNKEKRRDRNESENDTIKIKNERNVKENIQRHTFKTFGVEIQNDENGEHEINENKFYSENNYKKSEKKDQRRNRRDNNKMRSSYESINSDTDIKEQEAKRKSTKTSKKYYNERREMRDTSADEFSDTIESRQFLPRTKLTKTNSNNSQQGGALTDYGETLQRRLKSPDYDCKFEETKNGNMYGPWYDLWGLDRSVHK